MFPIRATAAAIGCLLWLGAAQAELSGTAEQIVVDGVVLRFGDTIEVHGVCIPDRDWDAGPATIRVLRIAGRPTQQPLDLRISVNTADPALSYDALSKLRSKTHLLVRGTLTNARIGGVHNVGILLPEQVRPVAPADLRVAEFVGREAVFEGQAIAGGTLKYGDETVRLDGIDDWPEPIRGKQVSVGGTVRKDDRGLVIERPTWKLFRLEDLVNQRVDLEGALLSLNGVWWFEYRDQRLDLVSPAGPTLRFDSENHYRRARVRGDLVLQERPSLHQISLKSARDLVPTYAIRGAAVELTGRAVSWEEKLGPIYRSHQTSKNGVPELLAESSFRRNLLGNETDARLFAERNRPVIQQILREISPAHADEIARRMSDEKTNDILRLLYATILAGVDDRRGSAYLLERARATDQTLDLNLLYCLGEFPFLAREADRKVDAAWAEAVLVEIMRNTQRVELRGAVLGDNDGKRVPIASAAAFYSSIPAVLRFIGSENCRRALLEFVKAQGSGSKQVARELCRWEPPPAPADLLEIDRLVADRGVHREVLWHLLAQKSPQALDRFAGELENGFVYMDFRDHLWPEMVDALKRRLDGFTGKARVHAQMLIALGQQDAVGELLNLLADERWTDKNLVFYELARLGDPRAVAPVARFLRETQGTVKDDDGLSATNTVTHALDAIAHTGTAAAIRELIELLPVDLARFGGYIKRDEWPLVIAGHLIELTGESFGTDVEKWRAWQRAHPDHSVPANLANPESVFRLNSGSAVDIGR